MKKMKEKGLFWPSTVNGSQQNFELHKTRNETKHVLFWVREKIEFEWLVISDENWVISDEWWVMKIEWPFFLNQTRPKCP